MKKVLIVLGGIVILAFTACGGGSATQTSTSSDTLKIDKNSDVTVVSNKTTLALGTYPPIPQIPADK